MEYLTFVLLSVGVLDLGPVGPTAPGDTGPDPGAGLFWWSSRHRVYKGRNLGDRNSGDPLPNTVLYFLFIYACVFCVCTCFWAGAPACACMFIWRPEVSVGCLFQFLSALLRQDLFTEPGAH